MCAQKALDKDQEFELAAMVNQGFHNTIQFGVGDITVFVQAL